MESFTQSSAMQPEFKRISEMQAALGKKVVTRTDIVAAAKEHADALDGQGSVVYLQKDYDTALENAHLLDQESGKSVKLGLLDGVTISVKDMFDVKGQRTMAGSMVLSKSRPAKQSATAVTRLVSAGALAVGRTNMTEFAYSGLGLNPHYGTPLNPYDRENSRIPGGSSSGAAVSVTDGMAMAAIGSDTGGSLRIPAALCGLVGFKPTKARMPMRGVYPLSGTLDTIGPIARSVTCCSVLDQVLAQNDSASTLDKVNLSALRLGVPDRLVLDNVDSDVEAAFQKALGTLSDNGVGIRDLELPAYDRIAEINNLGSFPAVESFAHLQKYIDQMPDIFDPLVLTRIEKGRGFLASNYIEMLCIQQIFIEEMLSVDEEVDAIIMPTVPLVAPLLKELENSDDYGRINLLMLRNPTIANLLDRPSISMPCHQSGELPVGFMMIGQHQNDRKLLAIAQAIEALISPNLQQ